MTDAGFGGAPPPGAATAGGVGLGTPPTSGVRKATFIDVVASEWIKLRSLRSTTVTSLITAVLAIGIGLLVCVLVAANPNNSGSPNDPTTLSLAGLSLAQLVVAILGVMAVSSEYSSGTISVSLMAAPRRARFMLAKVLVVTVLCFVLGEVLAFASFGIGQAILHGSTTSASLSEPQVLRAVFGAGLFLTALGLLGAGLGFLLRSTAGGIVASVAVIFVIPIITNFIPGTTGKDLTKYWPTQAGSNIYRVRDGIDTTVMAPWNGFGVMLAFVAVVLVVAFVVLDRRDA